MSHMGHRIPFLFRPAGRHRSTNRREDDTVKRFEAEQLGNQGMRGRKLVQLGTLHEGSVVPS